MLLSALHFGAAMLFLLAGAAGLLFIAPALAAGRFLDPLVAGVTHLLTLGWLTLTMLGALYQLLPVALGTPIRSVRAGYASIALLAPGVALFAHGVAWSDWGIRHAGLALVIPGLLVAIVNVGASLARAAKRDVAWWAVAVALTALFSTLVLGALLVHNLETGMLAGARVRVLSIHLHVAVVGWALAIVVGISQRLLPMFLLSHGVSTRWSARALVLLPGGTVVLVTGLHLASATIAWAGALVLACGLVSFLVQARQFYAARVRKRLDPGLHIAATGLLLLSTALVLGPLTLALGVAHPRVGTAYVVAGLGGILLYVVGHFYKIVPFLAWIARYRGRMGREAVPAIADLYSARVANVQWAVMSFGLFAQAAGTLAGHAHCVRAGAAFFAVGVLLFASQAARVALPLLRRAS